MLLLPESKECLCTNLQFVVNLNSFGQNKELVFAMKTALSGAKDWYRVKGRSLQHKSYTVASKDTATKNIAVAVSSRHNAIVLASETAGRREALLEFKQHCYEPLNLALNTDHTSFTCKLRKPISMAFSADGGRLIVVTGEVFIPL